MKAIHSGLAQFAHIQVDQRSFSNERVQTQRLIQQTLTQVRLNTNTLRNREARCEKNKQTKKKNVALYIHVCTPMQMGTCVSEIRCNRIDRRLINKTMNCVKHFRAQCFV